MSKHNPFITFIIGGIRSGKTSFVINQAKKCHQSVTYIATGLPSDKEMKVRIENHKKSRPKNWDVIEEPKNLLSAIKKVKTKIVIIDCINFWLANQLFHHDKYQGVKATGKNLVYLKKIDELCRELNRKKITTYIISNEIGMGLISHYKSGRIFHDMLGKINQVVSKHAKTVYLLVAGNPLKIK